MTQPSEELPSRHNPASIAEMFDRVAPRYDLMNRVMTAGLDRRWRRLAADMSGVGPGSRALDAATGTGDLARELGQRVAPGGEVVAIDIADAMLELARHKTADLPVRCEQRAVEDLEAREEFDAAIVAFGLRNFPDRLAAVHAMSRGLKPGGRLIVLELIPPRNALLHPVLQLYERRLIPLMGRLLGADAGAYRYLPESVAASLSAKQIAELLTAAGLQRVMCTHLTLGAVALCRGVKPS